MSFFSKFRSKLKWVEPEAYRRAEDQREKSSEKWWLRPVVIVGVAAALMLRWAGGFLDHTKHPPNVWIALSLALGLGFFLAYAAPWMKRRGVSQVSVYRHGIKRGDHLLTFKHLAGFSWVEEDAYYVLHLTTTKGRAVRYGVPDLATRDKLEALFYEGGLSKIRPEALRPAS